VLHPPQGGRAGASPGGWTSAVLGHNVFLSTVRLVRGKSSHSNYIGERGAAEYCERRQFFRFGAKNAMRGHTPAGTLKRPGQESSVRDPGEPKGPSPAATCRMNVQFPCVWNRDSPTRWIGEPGPRVPT